MLSTINGYRVYHLPTEHKIANARVVVNAGASDEENETDFGTAHFLEHMFFKGTKQRDYQEINKITSRLGNINAYTSRWQTCYHFNFLDSNFDEAVNILFEMVFQPSFPEEEFHKEKGVILEECQTRLDSPHTFFGEQLTQNLMGIQHGHPLVGSTQSIKNMSINQIHQFVEQYYNPNNILIAFIGNISEKQVIETVNQLPAIEGDSIKRTKPPLDFDDYHFHYNSKQAFLSIIRPGINLKSEIDANYTPDIFFNAMGGGMHSLLFNRLREELGLCYSINSSHASNALFGNSLITCMLNEENIPLAIKEINKITKRVQQEGFSDELIHISKQNMLFRLAQKLQTTNGISGMVDDYFDLDGYNLDHYVSYDHEAEKLATVTNDDLVAFSHKIFGDDQPTKIVTMTYKGSNQ